MKPVLVLYATTEGWTRRICERVAARFSEAEIPVDLVAVTEPPAGLDLSRYGGAVVAASLHFGKHQKEMADFVKDNATPLSLIPTAFVSVSLSQATTVRAEAAPITREKAAAEVQRAIQSFFAETGWRPLRVQPVAGALLYRKYGFLLRLVMRFIAGQSGASKDTSRDHDYTDWPALDAWAREIAPLLAPAEPALPVPRPVGAAELPV